MVDGGRRQPDAATLLENTVNEPVAGTAHRSKETPSPAEPFQSTQAVPDASTEAGPEEQPAPSLQPARSDKRGGKTGSRGDHMPSIPCNESLYRKDLHTIVSITPH
jgi:hypothetical protein